MSEIRAIETGLDELGQSVVKFWVMTRRRYRATFSREAFEQLVAAALAELPQDLRERMANVEIVVRDRPSRQELQRAGLGPGAALFGLYEGIPLTQRTSHYGMVLPDKVTLYQEVIEACCRSEAEIVQRVRRTVLHELAHHFGISDDRLRELGAY